jgi:hypothetical protein
MKALLTRQIDLLVATAYASDPTLIEKWHITAGKGLSACISQTIEDLKTCPTLEFYQVMEDGQFVGYFGIENLGNYLVTLFLKPELRSRRDEFWKLIEEKMNPTWKAGIYSKNIPCLKFYSKRGKEIAKINTDLGEVTLFEFKRSASSCQ